MNLDIIPNGAIKRVHVSQNDVGRTLTFELFNNSTTYAIPSGAVIKIQGTKPNGLGFSEICTINNNLVTVDTTEAMTEVSGNIPTELSIQYDGVVIGTSNFVLAVERNPHPDGTVDGTGDNPVIENLEVIITNAVDEWLDEHPEATTTVADGSLTEAKFSDALKLETIKDYVTPEMFGAKGDGEADDAEAFYSMFDWMIANGISLAFVPEGEYHISQSLGIPENCTLIGTGYNSFIYLSEETDLGVALTNGGSNVTIKNLRVGNIEDTEPISGSGYGGIGISVYSYDCVKNETLDEQADASNIIIENIFATGSYPIQIEASAGYTLKSVVVKNIYAPNGLVSNTSSANATHEDISFQDIICDVFRFNYNAGIGKNIFISNINTNYIRLNSADSVNCVVENASINTNSNSLYKATFNNNSALYINGDFKLSNIDIYNNDSVTYGIYVYGGNSVFDNVNVSSNFGTKNVEFRIATNQTFFNCNFGSQNSTLYGKGYSTDATLVGGSVGIPKYIDDTTIYSATPTSTYSDASSVIPSKVERVGNLCKVRMLKVITGSISSGTLIATLPYASYYPSSDRILKAKAFNIDQSATYDVELKVSSTDGKITLENPYILTFASSLTVNRLYINDFYIL